MAAKNGSHVTLEQLNEKLSGFRWEMRALVLAAIVAGQFIPFEDARAFIPFLP